MNFEKFESIVLELKKQDKIQSKLYKCNVDLLDFIDPYHKIISELLIEVYGEEGYDWFSWFCYENNYGEKGLGAWDENKNPICQDIKGLWEYLEHKKQTKPDKTLELAEKLKSEEKNKSKSLKTLQDAKILGENGEFTEQYLNLNKIFKDRRKLIRRM